MSPPAAALPPVAAVSRVRSAASTAVSKATGTAPSSAPVTAAGSGAGHRVRSEVPAGAAVRIRTENGPSPVTLPGPGLVPVPGPGPDSLTWLAPSRRAAPCAGPPGTPGSGRSAPTRS